jgi:hypothetical protein
MRASGLSLRSVALLGRATPSSSAPPVAGYTLWAAPESRMYSDTGATSLVTANNSEVRYWEDLSGAGNHLKFSPGGGHPAAGPIIKTGQLNGLRALRFGENATPGQVKTGLITDSNVALSGGITIFLVGGLRSPISAAEEARTFVGYQNFDILLRQQPSTINNFSAYHNSSGTTIGSAVDRGNTDYLQTLRFDDAGNQFRLWVNGTQAATAADAGATPSGGRIAVGYRQDDAINSHLTSGNISEVLIYPSALSDGNRALVETFLIAKYAL